MFGKVSFKWLWRSIVLWSVLLFVFYLVSGFINNSRSIWPALYLTDGNQQTEMMTNFTAFVRGYYWVRLILSPIAKAFLLWHGLDCVFRILKYCQGGAK